MDTAGHCLAQGSAIECGNMAGRAVTIVPSYSTVSSEPWESRKKSARSPDVGEDTLLGNWTKHLGS